MLLILDVISYKGAPPASALSARFDEQGGTIGRSPENHLALPDEEKFISRHHAEIRYENGSFVLTDTSTGGTWLCNEERLLTHGASQLVDGDRLKIGEYELRARIENAASAGPTEFDALFTGLSAPAPDGAPAFGENGQGNFADMPPLFDDRPSAQWPLSPPPETPPAVGLMDQPEVPPFQQHFAPPDIQHNPAPPSVAWFSIDDFQLDGFEPQPIAPPAEENDFDLFDQFLSGGLGSREELFQAPHPPAGESIQPGLGLAEPSPSGPVGQAGLAVPPDSGAGLAEPVASADIAAGPEQSFDLLGDSLSVPAMPAFAGRQADGLPPIPRQPSRDDLAGLQASPTIERPAPAINMPRPGRSSAPPPASPAVATPAQPVSVPPALSVPPPQPSAPPPTPAGVDLFQCFLDGAGLADFPNLTAEEQMRAMRIVGAVYRDMVDGMMMVLRARTEEKREMRRTDVTIMQSRRNNPLKFLPTPDHCMRVMVSHKDPAYIDPDQAVREGFADIMKHQLAMRAGMQEATKSLLKRFDPNAFEELYKEGIVFQKKTKCWEAYSKAYPNLVEEALDDLFGDAFSAAYQEQMRKLRNPHS